MRRWLLLPRKSSVSSLSDYRIADKNIQIDSVHEDVHQFEQGTLLRHLQQCLEREAGVTPNSLLRTRPYGTSQFSESLCLVHRVAAGECDIGKLIVSDDTHQLLSTGITPLVKVPRMTVVTFLALVCAARTVDSRSEAGTVYCCIFDNIKNFNHLLFLLNRFQKYE